MEGQEHKLPTERTTGVVSNEEPVCPTPDTVTGSTTVNISPPNSGNCELPTSDSKQHWSQPRTVRQFAAQVNAVATRVLNGEIDMDTAKVYGGLARTLAQAVTSEVTRARFLKTAPDLTLEDTNL